MSDTYSMNDYIEAMGALGCLRITFARDEKKQAVVSIDQRINTDTSASLIQHNCAGKTFEEAAENAMAKAEHCARLRPAELSVV